MLRAKSKNILVLEDNKAILDNTCSILENEGYYCYKANSIYEANDYWTDKSIKIEAIVTDMNMSPLGLNDREKVISKVGMFSGFIWVVNYVFNSNIRNGQYLMKKTLIVSEYVNNLKSALVELADTEKPQVNAYVNPYECINRLGNFIPKNLIENPYSLIIKKLRDMHL